VKQQSDRCGGVVSVHGNLDFMATADTRSGNYPRYFDFIHRWPAVAFSLTAMIGSHEDDGLFTDASLREGIEHVPDETIDLIDCLKVLGRFPPEGVAGVIHVIKVNEQEGRFVFQDHFDGPPSCVSGAFDVLDEIGCVGLDQPAKAVPIMNHSDPGVGLWTSERADDGGEKASGSLNGRGNVEFVRLPIVGGNAMLLRAGAHNHGSPVGTARCGHNSSRMERVGAFTHHAMQHRGVRLGERERTKAVTADDQQVLEFGGSLAGEWEE